jgi:hypothetical protein
MAHATKVERWHADGCPDHFISDDEAIAALAQARWPRLWQQLQGVLHSMAERKRIAARL